MSDQVKKKDHRTPGIIQKRNKAKYLRDVEFLELEFICERMGLTMGQLNSLLYDKTLALE